MDAEFLREVKPGNFDLRAIGPEIVLDATGLDKITWGNGWVEKRGRFYDASTSRPWRGRELTGETKSWQAKGGRKSG